MNIIKKMLNVFNKKYIYICTNKDTRNRYKRDEYKISFDKPQCPIYKDDRCCGNCKKASYCDHCVNCNCFGYAYAQRGGNDTSNYMRKCSDYSIFGRIKDDGKFDWEYYKINRNKHNLKIGKFTVVKQSIVEILNIESNFSYITCKIIHSNEIVNFNIDEFYYDKYDTYEEIRKKYNMSVK